MIIIIKITKFLFIICYINDSFILSITLTIKFSYNYLIKIKIIILNSSLISSALIILLLDIFLLFNYFYVLE